MSKESMEKTAGKRLELRYDEASRLKTMTKVAIMGAVSFIIMNFEFPPMFVSFETGFL